MDYAENGEFKFKVISYCDRRFTKEDKRVKNTSTVISKTVGTHILLTYIHIQQPISYRFSSGFVKSVWV